MKTTRTKKASCLDNKPGNDLLLKKSEDVSGMQESLLSESGIQSEALVVYIAQTFTGNNSLMQIS